MSKREFVKSRACESFLPIAGVVFKDTMYLLNIETPQHRPHWRNT